VETSYYGKDEAWAPLAPGLKTLDDALDIRQRVLLAFEQAEREADVARRHANLTFVVVGGGPTGVEMAADHCGTAAVYPCARFQAHRPA
jgi:NADH dehydrogenase